MCIETVLTPTDTDTDNELPFDLSHYSLATPLLIACLFASCPQIDFYSHLCVTRVCLSDYAVPFIQLCVS